jgi:hypothetical protein
MRKRNAAQFDAFVMAYANGMEIEEFCKLKHLKYDTVRKWTSEPAFKSGVAEIQARLYEAFIGTLTGAMKEAANGLLGLARGGATDSVKLQAWRGIIDDLMRLRSATKVEADIQALNARLDEIEGGKANGR